MPSSIGPAKPTAVCASLSSRPSKIYGRRDVVFSEMSIRNQCCGRRVAYPHALVRTTLVLVAGISWTIAHAADVPPPGTYSLSVGRVHAAKPDEPAWVFIIGGTGTHRGGEMICKDIASLKTVHRGLPTGSSVDWWPTCSGESRAVSDRLDEIQKVCAESGLKLTVHPAG